MLTFFNSTCDADNISNSEFGHDHIELMQITYSIDGVFNFIDINYVVYIFGVLCTEFY